MKTFKFYSDSQHGWLAVKHSTLCELGIENKITQFSYLKGQTAYLEEDCDAATFFKAYKEKFGQDPVVVNFHTKWSKSSPIRSYNRYKTLCNK